MENKKLKKLRLFYSLIILLLVVSAFAVPYTLLSSINLFRGAFLFWSLFVLIVIFLTIKITGYWRE
jgi:membrane-associated HD superfamily phosphohydrolase